MEEQLISFETAKIAKEKGFDIPKIGYWNINFSEENWSRRKSDNSWQKPTQSLLQKWLREEHNFIITIIPYFDDMGTIGDDLYGTDGTYSVFIHKMNKFKYDEVDFFTYEDALEDGLKAAMDFISTP